MLDFGSSCLLMVRRKALRGRVWFKVLSSSERAILGLVPRCVDEIRSPELIDIVAKIIVKVCVALRSPLERFRSHVAKPLAERISLIAQRWGNMSAKEWAEDRAFIWYLAVVKFSDVPVFR